MFSRRIPGELRPNALARARAERGAIPYDLTVSNPTACDLPYPEGLLEPLRRAEGQVYLPDPMGLPGSRQAVAEDYARRGRRVDPDRVVLAASTSEAYSLLFKLLCEPGESVLVPTPSYPLLEHLASLDGVRAKPYALDPGGGWQPHPGELEGRGARAVVAVHPNNPTGSYLDPRVATGLAAACAQRERALVVDEVFFDYPLDESGRAGSFASCETCLTFTLGGLSKYLGLPQLKLAWIVASGPAGLVGEALHRLAFIADQYLSVGTPVQLALPELLRRGAGVRAAILERCRRNLAALRTASAAVPAVSVLPVGGGWSVVLRVPSIAGEETLALELLEEDGVGVHPGYFFDFPVEGYFVLSLLPRPDLFDEGARRLLARVAGRT